MGRGRTTTGMIAASLIARITLENNCDDLLDGNESDTDDDLQEETQYMNGAQWIDSTDFRRVQDDSPARDGLVPWQR